MINRSFLAAGIVASTLFAASAATAASGVATGDVNLRAGPGTGYAVITTIPAGAPLEIYGCSSWCQVSYGGTQGYVSGNYVSAGRAVDPYAYATPVRPRYYNYAPSYGYAPAYGYGYGPSVSFGFGFGDFDGDHHRRHYRHGRHYRHY